MAESGRRVASQVQPDEVAPPREVREASEVPEVRAARKSFEDPQGKLREQVLAERGLTAADILRLSGQDRIRAEIAIMSEIARRAGRQRLLDLRA